MDQLTIYRDDPKKPESRKMVKSSSVDKNGVKKGAWSEDEDGKLRAYIRKYGHWNWRLLPKFTGLSRTGKSCRLRWVNYLRPNVKLGNFTKEEDNMIVDLHKKLGNKWSVIAAKLPGRSDNEIKNRWNTQLKKRAQDVCARLESEHHKTMEPNRVNTKENLNQEFQNKGGTNVESSSPSSTVTELPSCWLSGLGCADLSIVASQTSDYQLANDFWTQPFIQDTTSVDSSSWPYVLDKLISPSSSQDMTMIDEFSWSMLDSYFEYSHE